MATSWSATNGGINSINYDLCNSLYSKTSEIYCLIPSSDSTFDADEKPENIKVLKLHYEFSEYNKSLDTVTEFLNIKSSDNSDNLVWIGHDAITGGAAIFSKNSFGGLSVVFHHMDYSNYYHLKNKSAVEKKINVQKTILKTADIVFAVGPRLLTNAKRIRKADLETYEFIPGAPNFNSCFANRKFDYRIAICGRLDDDNDPIKNISAGIKASHHVLSNNSNNAGAINLIGTNSQSGSIYSRLGLSNNVAINEISYIADRESYFKELVDNDILLMPSLKEGFGLVAWEAANLGIPVLVSESSGFHEYLKQNNLESYVFSIKMRGLPISDEREIRQALLELSTNYDLWHKKAADLAQELNKISWNDVGIRFLQLLPGETSAIEPSATIEIAKPQKTKRGNTFRNRENADQIGGDFSRFEDLLSLTYKKRQVVISATEGRDFSRGAKIKFELWKVFFALREEYFLYIHPNTNLGQTIERLFQVTANKNIKIGSLHVLRKDGGESGYIQKLISQISPNINICEYSIKDYIWEFCIEESFKNSKSISAPLNYIDQSLRYKVGGNVIQDESSKSFLLTKLLDKPKCAAHLVVAPGGMGKTWLCLSLADGINHAPGQKRLVVLITAETLRIYFSEVGHNHIQINSLYDLYDAYTKACRSEESYDRETFELSVLSGNITVIIDGLDELASVLQERFDLHLFLESIYELSSGLNSSQILLTTRDNHQLNDINLNEFNIEQYELLGFSDKDWEKYARKRFRENTAKEQLKAKLLKLLSQSELQDSDGRVIPFFLDVVCSILEEDEREKNCEDFDLAVEQKDYPANNSVTDNIIYSVFRREIRRQGIGIGIDNLVELVSEVVSENGEIIDKSTLKHLFDLYYDTRSNEILQKVLLNPLFICSENHLKLKYGFLSSYFRSLYIINTITNSKFTTESLNALAKANGSNSPEIEYVKKFFFKRKEELDRHVAKLLPQILSVVRSNKDSDPKKSETARRAISGLLKIYVHSKNYSGSQISEKILDFFSNGTESHRTIDGLNVYGDFPSLDFSNTTILNSKFLDYKNFSKSKFKEAKFMYCTFDSCASEASPDSSILSATFDNSCALGDLEKLIDQVKSKESLSAKLLEEDCLTFLRSFWHSGTNFDPKLGWIKFSNRVDGLKRKNLNSLIPSYVKVKSKKSDENYYALADDFVESARRFVDNNYKDVQFKQFLEFLCK
ncbi:glycosyltransferase [Undibacterium rivi]|uniref:glycosyltransferase n=1 Tax=Undibacterium rivi TaxID=2828729 RepID=UPI001E2AC622|nr:glycosyltransferase [Undibacterium rivi]